MKSKSSRTKSLPQQSHPLLKHFHDSATILTARITAVSGFVTAVIGGLDWSPLLGITGFDRKQVIALGGVILLIGVSHEIARRRTLDA